MTHTKKHGGLREGSGRKKGGSNANKIDRVPKQVELPIKLFNKIKARAAQDGTTDTAVIVEALEIHLEVK